MSPEEFKAALERTGYSQVGFARLVGVNDRTGRRWARGEQEIPQAAMLVLQLIERFGLTTEVMARIAVARIGDEFGPPDPYDFVWVKPKHDNSEWTVARRNNDTRDYELPGLSSKFSLSELHLGPIVHRGAMDIADPPA